MRYLGRNDPDPPPRRQPAVGHSARASPSERLCNRPVNGYERRIAGPPWAWTLPFAHCFLSEAEQSGIFVAEVVAAIAIIPLVLQPVGPLFLRCPRLPCRAPGSLGALALSLARVMVPPDWALLMDLAFPFASQVCVLFPTLTEFVPVSPQ